jgi:hypothetical protein
MFNKSIFIILGIIFLVIFSRQIFLRKLFSSNKVTLDEIPLLVDALKQTGADNSFALFLFPEKGSSNDLCPGLQFSIEKGKLGIDYLLNSKFNVREKDKFIKFLSELNCSYAIYNVNDCEYIRTEDGFLTKNFQEMLKLMYNVKDDQKMEVELSGFKYSK